MIGRALLCLAVTASPLVAQQVSRPLRIGIRGGAEIHRGGWGPEHVGLQAWIPLRDRLVVVPALDLLHEFPDDPLGAWSGRAWRAYLTIRGRPFRRGWLPDVGYGLTVYYVHADNAGRSLKVSNLDLTDTAVFALPGPRWRIRPYAELYLVNILRRAGQIGGHLFFGLSVAVR